MLAKQAKAPTKSQIALLQAFLAQTRYPARNTAIFLLSVKAGLRANESLAAVMAWWHELDATEIDAEILDGAIALVQHYADEHLRLNVSSRYSIGR